MKSAKILISSVLIAGVVIGLSAFIRGRMLRNDTGKGFAVVELFTSEGCSSCPPADQLVARIQKEDAGEPVYILAYHVDYWNRLGWKDAFSSAAYSKRQEGYAAYLHLQSVYTPQIVVNGSREFVGSDEGALRNAIRSGLAQKPTAGLALQISASGAGEADIHYTAGGYGKNTELLVAVLEKNAQTDVKRGENQGRLLHHVQIVRQLQAIALKDHSGSVKLRLPEGFNSRDWEIVGFLQDKANGHIIAGARALPGQS